MSVDYRNPHFEAGEDETGRRDRCDQCASISDPDEVFPVCGECNDTVCPICLSVDERMCRRCRCAPFDVDEDEEGGGSGADYCYHQTQAQRVK